MKLVNSWIALVLPSISTPFLIMMFRQASRSFPIDIIEASRLEGMSEIGIFFRMFIPTMKSTYSAALIITFMNAWNNYMWPMIVLQTETKKTITLMVSKIIGSAYLADYGVQMVGLAIATLPMMIVFLVLQRSFVDGLTGSVKG